VGAIALVAAPLAAIWALVGFRLGTMQEERAHAIPAQVGPAEAITP
jgi:hypothetical protein